MKSLESPTLRLHTYFDCEYIHPNDASLPHLRELNLFGFGYFGPEVLQHFKTPALRRLVLTEFDTLGFSTFPIGLEAQLRELFWEEPRRKPPKPFSPGFISSFRDFLLQYSIITTTEAPYIAKYIFGGVQQATPQSSQTADASIQRLSIIYTDPS